MNLGELEQSLKSTQAALIVSEENRRYFTGFNASNGYLLVTRDGSTFITDGRYIEDAKRIVKDAEVLLQDHVYNQLNRLMQRYSCNEILVEASRMSILDLNNYRRMLNSYTFNVSSRLDRLISSLREVKLDWEIEQMKRAQAIAEKALLDTLPFLKAGARERDVANELDYRMRKYGADGLSFDTIVVSGDNSSKPHGVPGEKVIEDGDFVTIDYGALYNGYHSDTTRTFAVGSVTEEMANVYNTVLKAQMAGCEALRPGMTAEEYDAWPAKSSPMPAMENISPTPWDTVSASRFTSLRSAAPDRKGCSRRATVSAASRGSISRAGSASALRICCWLPRTVPTISARFPRSCRCCKGSENVLKNPHSYATID